MVDIDVSSVRIPALVRNLNDMRASGSLTDARLHVNGRSFPVHRNVLAAGSPYFATMFTKGLQEAQQEDISIHGVGQEAMAHVLHFIYTGKLSLTGDCFDTVQDLVQASDFLQVVDLHRACEEWLVKRVIPSNCVSLYFLARTYNCKELAQAARWTVVSDFADVSKGSEFIGLDLSQVTELVSDVSFYLHKGANISDALVRWTEHNHAGDVGKFMKHVRYNTMKPLSMRQQMLEDQVMGDCPTAAQLCKVRTAAQVQVGLDDAMRNPQSLGLIPSLRCGTRRTDTIVSVYKTRDCVDLRLYETRTKIEHGLPTPYRASNLSIIVSQDNKLYVAGGVRNDPAVKNPDKNVKLLACAYFYVYDSLHNKWWEKANMYVSKFDFALASVGSHVYAIGGKHHPHGKPLYDVEKYNPEENAWHMMAQLPYGLNGHHAVTIEHNIYVLCGFDSPRSKDVFCYQTLTDTWTNVAPMPAIKRIDGAAVAGGKIYTILSSWKNASWKPTTMEMYNPENDQWEEDKKFLTEEVEAVVGPVAVEDRLYLCSTGGLYVMQPTDFPCPMDQWSLYDKNVVPRSGQTSFHFTAGCVHIDGLNAIAS
ncbi:KBTBD8 [Branchiostoma lanceolatum]|uniref:KBTBD8 protein n=1 Tax=Branchiostoma lanceolatum TaxID=7740 RepID=A0A8K0AA58_BRALA|nr:KBTBD8 [Branchiostoma lanceolatum]